MRRRHLLWAIVLVLFMTFVIQLAEWRNLYTAKKQLSTKDFTTIIANHQRLHTQLDHTQERLQRLENTLLWEQPYQLLPKLGSAANALAVKLVGVDQLPPIRRRSYQSSPLRLTFSGDYAGFSALLSTIEKISPPLRIDELRLYQRQRYPGTLWMQLVIATMHRKDTDESPTKIEMPKPALIALGRDAFTFGNDAEPIAIQPPEMVPTEIPLPKLTGILWDESQPIAIFTDRLMRSYSVREGGVIAEARVIEIHPQVVVLKHGEETHELRLWETDQRFSVR